MRLLYVIMVCALGCGEQSYDAASEDYAPAANEMAVMKAKVFDGEAEPETAVPSATPLQRKIIYTASLDLVVEEFTPIPPKVEALATQFEGYVANSNIAGSPGSPRSGQWTVRVPVAHYKEFLEAARELGEVRTERADSQDVSEKYYDLKSRIRNKKKQEERLLELLADATGKLEEVLKVEHELARVREEIERMEGRVRVFDDLTALTTVELSVHEIRNYVPEEAATYTTRLRRALDKSLDSFVSVAQNVSIVAVAASPWVGVLLVPVLALAMFVRARRRRNR